jgi:hypothetical protein
MKVYKIEVMVIDHDDVGSPGILNMLEDARYPNDAITPKVISAQMKDIGEWTDEHPLNKRDTALAYYTELFSNKEKK